MADVRCPQCNSLNASDAEKCWNCEAALQPQETSGDSFDWLSDLRGGEMPPEGGNEPDVTGSESNDTPDWLKRVRARSQSEQDFGEPSGEAEPADDLPDWLKDLGSFGHSEEDTIPPPAGGIEGQDWFQGLSSFSSEPRQDAGEDQIPDWLLEDAEGSAPAANQPGAGGGDELPDWYSQEEKDAAAGDQTQAFQRDELPNWLFEGGQESSEPEQKAQPTGDDLPDWLSEGAAETEPQAEQPPVDETILPGGELPDWLSELSTDSEPSQPAPSAEDTAAFSPGELPDWLSEGAAETEPQAEQPPVDETVLPGNELPDWLSELSTDGEPSQPVPSAEETAAYSPGELPDWLSEGAVEPEPQAEQPPVDETLMPGDELPDWLAELPAVDGPDQSAAPAQETGEEPVWRFDARPTEPDDAAPFEELPAWLLSDEIEAPPPEQPSSEEFEIEAEPVEAVPDAGEEPIQAEVQEHPQEEVVEDAALAAFEMEELPEWLSEEQVDLPKAESDVSKPAFIMDDEIDLDEPVIEQAHPFSEEDIPSWLSPEEELESEETESEDLTRTTLPNWVEAMRPVEAVALSGPSAAGDEVHTEKAGPLAGLTGVLPAESTVIEYGRPPTYSMRLRVSDKQRASAALLETILEEESKPQEIKRERPGVSQAILRLLVGILLITVIVLSGGLSEISGMGASAGNPISAISFNQQIDALPRAGTVLLAVDYDPGYSSEMILAGQAVVEQLISRDNRLVIVSTSLAGPVLGDDLIRAASARLSEADDQEGERAWVAADHVVNLGFLAGGVVSLKEFALSPQMAARYGMDWVVTGQPAWGHPALQNIQGITDFSLVLVMTDSGDTGRMWIEQVRPHMGDVPMLMITTAQAAPVLHPYLTAGQIDGIISGLAGGRSFSRETPAGIASTWLAFRAALLASVVLILLGILFRGISSLIPDPKP
jgi:hypothetical protein